MNEKSKRTKETRKKKKMTQNSILEKNILK